MSIYLFLLCVMAMLCGTETLLQKKTAPTQQHGPPGSKSGLLERLKAGAQRHLSHLKRKGNTAHAHRMEKGRGGGGKQVVSDVREAEESISDTKESTKEQKGRGLNRQRRQVVRTVHQKSHTKPQDIHSTERQQERKADIERSNSDIDDDVDY
jgi:hypothetical protein